MQLETTLISHTRQQAGGSIHRSTTLTSHLLAVERVIQTMRKQPAEPLSLDDLADLACLSPYHFTRVFRSITGIPPGEFLSALRLDTARRLLLTTSLHVTDICFEVGYTSLGTFTTRFTQLIGLPPGQLRTLAERFARHTPALPLRPTSQPNPHTPSIPGVHGQIIAPTLTSGTIFIGLFPKAIPQNYPVACTILSRPGSYHIAPVPDGHYYLLAAALPQTATPLTYLLPDAGILVGSSQRPLHIGHSGTSYPVNICLRPLQPSDPPLLISLPLLLARKRPADPLDSPGI